MSTLDRINKCLEELGLEKSTDESQRFTEDLGLDSLDWIELSLMLEDEFGIEIPEEDYEEGQITTVKQAVEYLDKRLAEEQT